MLRILKILKLLLVKAASGWTLEAAALVTRHPVERWLSDRYGKTAPKAPRKRR